MRRVLGSPLIRYNYLKNFKKPIEDMRQTKPPKYIYVVSYHPSAMPDLDMKFKDHHHFSDWINLVYGEEDKYEFQYSGQWWDAVSVSSRVIIVCFIVATLVSLRVSSDDRKSKHLPGIGSSHRVEDVAFSHLPTVIQN